MIMEICRLGAYGKNGEFNECLIGLTCDCEKCELFKQNDKLRKKL